MKIPNIKLYLIPVLLFSFAASVLWAQESGKTVILRGIVEEDLYAAGRIVDIQAEVWGDAVVAGQDVSIEQFVQGDVIAAGETVDIRATVADDVRVAGRRVTITGTVGDHIVAAGETLRIHSSSTIGGRAWFAGQRIDVMGNIGGELKAIGEHISVAGEVGGDAVLVAEHIEILPGAHIRGQLIYHSPNKPQVHDNARIDGDMIERPMPSVLEQRAEDQAGATIVFSISLMVAGLVYLLVFPHFSVAAAHTIGSDPWKSLALGLALLVTVPFVIFLLLITVVGHLLALVLLAAYLVFLLAGFLSAVFYVADSGLKMIGKSDEISRGLRSAGIIVTIIVLGILQLIPLLGGLIIFLLLLFGLGALNLCIWRIYKTT
ncbi:MAG: hypothetical protein ACN4GR_00605 [Arenicellales bacterium]